MGIEKLDAMCVQFTDAERAQMLAFKAAFDPQGLLNPGKAIPSLHGVQLFNAHAMFTRDGAAQ